MRVIRLKEPALFMDVSVVAVNSKLLQEQESKFKSSVCYLRGAEI